MRWVRTPGSGAADTKQEIHPDRKYKNWSDQDARWKSPNWLIVAAKAARTTQWIRKTITRVCYRADMHAKHIPELRASALSGKSLMRAEVEEGRGAP